MRKRTFRHSKAGFPLMVVITSAAITVITVALMAGFQASPTEELVQPQNTQPVIAQQVVKGPVYSMPVRLVIPKIGINATITDIGLTSSGNMEAPNTNDIAGWYKYGPKPGNDGSAVLGGHFGVGEQAIFTDLNQLDKGDTLSIIDDQGQRASFVVREVRTYAQDSQPNEVFNSLMGAHLNLITCDGAWESGKRTYSQRLVIFTDRQV